jgi:hypothetical protein
VQLLCLAMASPSVMPRAARLPYAPLDITISGVRGLQTAPCALGASPPGQREQPARMPVVSHVLLWDRSNRSGGRIIIWPASSHRQQ